MKSNAMAAHLPGCELYLGNLDENMTEDILFTHFHGFGKIVHVKINRHVISRASLGYGFLTFARPHEAQRAAAAMNKRVILKNRVRVFLVEQFNSLDKNANLVVRGLPAACSAEQLEAAAEQFGAVFSVKLVDEDLTSKRGYVQFEAVEAAQRCADELKQLGGVPVAVESALRRNALFVRGNHGEKSEEQLRELLRARRAELLTYEVDEARTGFMASARFEAEPALRDFVQAFRARRADYPLIRDCGDVHQRKELRKNFKSAENLFCRVVPLSDAAPADRLRQEIGDRFGELLKFSLSRAGGENELFLVFAKTQSLVDFVTALYRNQSPVNQFLPGPNFKTDYPHFIIKVVNAHRQKLEPPARGFAGRFAPPFFGAPPPRAPFGSVEEILRSPAQFALLSGERRRAALQQALEARLRELPELRPRLASADNSRRVVRLLTDPDIVSEEELLRALRQPAEFARLVAQCLDA